jgi:hypothetical protein
MWNGNPSNFRAERLAADLTPTFESTTQRDLVGVFKVSAYWQSAS